MDWITSIDNKLAERDKRVEQLCQVVACFSELSCGTERLLDECAELKERCKQVELEAEGARSELQYMRRSSLTSLLPSPIGSPSNEVKKIAELEAKHTALKDERSELYKAQSQNTLKLLELTDQIKQRESRIVALNEEVAKEKQERVVYDRKLEDYENLVKEKNLTIQILQDELTALQLELIKMDEQQSKDVPGTIQLRRVSVGGKSSSLPSTVHAPSMEDERFEIVSSTKSIINLPDSFVAHNKLASPDLQDNLSTGDSLDSTFALAAGNVILVLEGSNKWTIKVNSKVVKVSLKLLEGKKIVLAGRRDGIVSMISSESHRIRGQLVSPDTADLMDMKVTEDGEHIWTLSSNSLKYWHCDRSICLRTIPLSSARCFCFNGDESAAYIAIKTGISRFNVASGELREIYQANAQCVSLSSAGGKFRDIFLATFPDRVMLFQRDNPIQTFPSHINITTSGFYHDTHIFVLADKRLSFYGLSGFESERCLEFPEPIVQFLSDMQTILCQKTIFQLPS